MRSCRSRICRRKRVEDNHVRFVGGRKEDPAVAAAVVILKNKSRWRGNRFGRRRWRKRSWWESFGVL